MTNVNPDFSYREMVHDLCSKVDLDNKEDVVDVMKFLANEAVKNNDISKRCDSKLQELMSYKDFKQFSYQLAKEVFLQDVNAMPECDFKNFVVEHFDEITGEKKCDGRDDAQKGEKNE